MIPLRCLAVTLLSPWLLGQGWSLAEEGVPDFAFVVHDAAKQRTTGFSSFPVTTAWNLTATGWRRVVPDGLEGTYVECAAYDPQRASGVVVVQGNFGWRSHATCFSRGAGWLASSYQSTPDTRYASCAFDGTTGRVVVFGGTPGSVLSDQMHAWNGTAWIQLQPAVRPSPRQGAGMAHDPVRNRLVLFGGFDGFGMLGDTWEWDGTQWAQRATAVAPSPRQGQLVWEPSAQRVVQLGGVGTNFQPVADCWRWDGAQWTARGSLPGGERAVGWNDGTSLFLSQSRGRVFRANGANWVAVVGASGQTVPAEPAIAFDPVRGGVLLAGGVPAAGTLQWNGRWQQISTTDTGTRAYGAMASFGGGLVLFGGMLPPLTVVGDTWTWNGQSWTLRFPAVQPTPRTHHRMTSTGNRALLFGGFGSMGVLDDLWEFDGLQWTQLQTPVAPPGRGYHGFAFDPLRQRAVLHGGGSATVNYTDTWEWDGQSWLQRFPANVPPPAASALVFDTAYGTIVMPRFDSFWSWNGVDWVSSTVALNQDVYGSAVAYDAVRQRMLVHGPFGSTWLFGPTPATAQQSWLACGTWPDVRLYGRPAVGSTPTIHLEGQPNAIAGLAFGLQQQFVTWALGCQQEIVVDASLFGAIGATGVWDQPFAVPNVLAFRGLQVFVQAVVLDGGPVLGASLSPTLRISVGD